MAAGLTRMSRTWLFFIACAVAGYIGGRTASGAVSPPAQPGALSQEAPPMNAGERMRQLQAGKAQTTLGQRAASALGLFVLVGICYLLSNNRRAVNWRLVAWGLGLQLLFGFLVLKTGPGLWLFAKLNDGTLALLSLSKQGTDFLFRSFVSGEVENSFVNFTFNVLPTIIFFSSLMTVGYYLGLMQVIVKAFAVVMHKTMRCSGAETLSTAANIFVGQTEAPLVVKPYLKDMTQSELMAVMVGGFANTAGGVLAAYVGMLHQHFPDIAGHLIAQSVMSAPAALACAKIVYPETHKTTTGEHVKMIDEKLDANVIDAAARGASEGLQLAFNVAAMLLAFISLIALGNVLLRETCAMLRLPVITLEGILAVPGAVAALIMGVPWGECAQIGRLIGIKTAVNEFVAYLQMAQMLQGGQELSYRSLIIASYALSGFANFSSIAIQIGGISAIAPSRRHDLAKLGLMAMVVGAIATFMTATIAGMLVG